MYGLDVLVDTNAKPLVVVNFDCSHFSDIFMYFLRDIKIKNIFCINS
jgi:hypothetical protein